MNFYRKLVLAGACMLLGGWVFANSGRLFAEPNAVAQMVLGIVFAVLILLRNRSEEHIGTATSSGPATAVWRVPLAAVTGMLLVIIGIVLDVHQLEWIGMLGLLCAALLWALPQRYSRDVLVCMVLLYWIHPLPGQLTGPFQLAMQRWSVVGAEWLLHCGNVRVWAEEIVLHTGFRTLGVPESCSGMRAAMTVFICALGVSLLLRFKWYEALSFIILGLFQVLFMNIVRISIMVRLADRMPKEWAETFLHDTLGIFLLVAVFVINLEALLWAVVRARKERRPVAGIRTPRRLKVAVVASVSLLLAAAVAFAAIKRRPYHRAMMTGGIVERLVWAKDFAAAEKACQAALGFSADDYELNTQYVQILILRKKFDEALKALANVSAEERRSFDDILKARALMGLGRPQEAMALVQALPEDVQQLPSVAMARAEFAAMNDDVEGVVANIVDASQSHLLIEKVTSLFPYLAVKEQWGAIKKSMPSDLGDNVTNVLIAVHAHLKLEDVEGTEKLLASAMQRWPDEPQFGHYLAAVAKIREEREWTAELDGYVDGIVEAAMWHDMINRVRALFPYLAVREQWRTIARCYSGLPHKDVAIAAISIHAHMKLGEDWRAGRILEGALEKWPDEPGLLQYVTGLALAKPGRKWEDAFATTIRASVDKLSADELAVYLEHSFRLSRPDLAWLVYSRLQKVDPKDPALDLALAQFGDRWFVFRKDYAGLPAYGLGATIDLRNFYFKRLAWPEAPLVDELAGGSVAKRMGRLLSDCLAELKARENDHTLSPRMKRMYPQVLRMDGRFKEAKRKEKDVATLPGDERIARVVHAVEVRLGTRQSAAAWQLLGPALAEWPDDWQLLECLGSLARENPGSGWEQMFEQKLKSGIASMGADALAVCVVSGFRMNRPDLAWLAYNRLQEIDPRDPHLTFAPIQFYSEWFRFRKQDAGLPSRSKEETVDLRTLYLKSRDWGPAPLAAELAAGLPGEDLDRYLKACLEALERREKNGNLSLRMEMMVPTVLALMGRYSLAHERLDMLVARYPDQQAELIFKHALFYHRERKWQEVYEALREYSLLNTRPRMELDIMRIDALMHLGLGSYALNTVTHAAKVFEGAPELHKAAAALWATFGAPEQALFEMQGVDGYTELPITTRLLWDTQRFNDARRVARLSGVELPAPGTEKQSYLLPAAEQAIAPQWDAPMSSELMAKESQNFMRAAESAVSPFIRDLMRLKASWYVARGRAGSPGTEAWLAAGRDDAEQGEALTELVMLLGRQQRYDEALDVGEIALALRPGSVALWRAMIGMSHGDPAIIARAYEACPTDPEVWLAHLVSKVQSGASREWCLTTVEDAINSKVFSIGTLIRAGDMMRRRGRLNAAIACVKHAVKHSQGLLPVYVLGLRCSLALQDTRTGVSYAKQAAREAVDPWPFVRCIAELEAYGDASDTETFASLVRLVEKFPEEPRWALRLADAYLLRGEPGSAVQVYESLVASKPKHIDFRTLLVAAEAYRRAGKLEKAVAILERAYVMHPSNRVVLNNLVFCLAFSTEGLPRAKELLPKLLELWGESFVALDTAAMVYRNAGEMQQARAYLERAARAVKEVDSVWLARNPTAVDMNAYMGEYDFSLDTGLSDLRIEGRRLSRRDLSRNAIEVIKKVKAKAHE